MNTQTQEALNIAIELLQIQIGELVLQKMRSGNDIPVSRCTITNSEIDALFNDIKKEALIKPEQELKGRIMAYRPDYESADYVAGYSDGREDALRFNQTQPGALARTAPSQWISVKDRLPEFVDISTYEKSSNDVLILIDGKHFYIGSYIWDSYSEETEFCMRDLDGGYEGVGEMEVTHWMPLPDAPKE